MEVYNMSKYVRKCNILVYINVSDSDNRDEIVTKRGSIPVYLTDLCNIVVKCDLCMENGWYIINTIKEIDGCQVGMSVTKVRSIGDNESYEDIIDIFALGVIPHAKVTLETPSGPSEELVAYVATNPGGCLCDIDHDCNVVLVVPIRTYDANGTEYMDNIKNTPHYILDYDLCEYDYCNYELLDQRRIASHIKDILLSNRYLSSPSDIFIRNINRHNTSMHIDTTEPCISTNLYTLGRNECGLAPCTDLYTLKFIPTYWRGRIATLTFNEYLSNDVDNPEWIKILYDMMKEN